MYNPPVSDCLDMERTMAKVSVIIPAGGSGRRFAGRRNKIFERIKDQPVFIRTIEAFSSRDDVCQIQLVVSTADMGEMKSSFGGHLGFMGVALVEGGATRDRSVSNALANVTDEAELVCVHDAVRPCICSRWVDAVFAKAAGTGAAILAYPVHGTLKRVGAGEVVTETASREDLWEAQTPQVFARELLVRAYASAEDGATDDSQLVEALGHPVSVVMGDPRNIKITTQADLALAAAVIGTLPKPKPKGPAHPFAEGQW
jgi:2-C-methyl-D-erythritol 4-phosphate cytidylyltransferase